MFDRLRGRDRCGEKECENESWEFHAGKISAFRAKRFEFDYIHRVKSRVRILGIDPGLRITGYGCIDADDSGETLVEGGVFRLGRADSKTDAARATDIMTISARLAELDADLRSVIARLKPDLVAVEQLFAHPKHPATSIVMGHARGVILLAVRHAGLKLMEIRPNEIKKSLTGFGHAKKGQMQSAIQAFFRLEEPPRPPDVADAIAIALCASNKRKWGAVTGATAPKRRAGGRGLRDLPAEVREQVRRSLAED